MFTLATRDKTMTKKITAICIACLIMISCTKNETLEIADPTLRPDISALPARFNQKILLEEFTSSMCGSCPETHLLRDSLALENTGRVIPISLHFMDAMLDSGSTNPMSGRSIIDELFNPAALYPSGILNRQVSGSADLVPENWRSKTASLLGNIPRCGLAIDASDLNGSLLKLNVYTGFTQDMFGDYRLHVYLVRDLIRNADTLYAQLNEFSQFGSNPDTSSPFYLFPELLINYSHKNVLTRVLNDQGINGDPIPAGVMRKGNQFIKTYTVNLAGISTSGLSIVAFVDKYGTDGLSHRIENVQKVSLGEIKDWN